MVGQTLLQGLLCTVLFNLPIELWSQGYCSPIAQRRKLGLRVGFIYLGPHREYSKGLWATPGLSNPELC